MAKRKKKLPDSVQIITVKPDPMRLTDEESATFEQIRGAPGIALTSGTFHGKRAAFIVFVATSGEGYDLTPLAMLLRPEDLDHVKDSRGELLSKEVPDGSSNQG